MKSSLVFAASIVLFLVSCGSKQVLIGTWQMGDFTIEDPNVGDVAKDYARDVAPTIQYTFEKDGTYHIRSKTLSKPTEGNWKAGPEKNTVILESGMNPKMAVAFELLEPGKLSCISHTTRMGRITFTLTKIEE